MAGIFISYRRSDSDVGAGRLADDLMQIFGPEAIFRDVDTLQLGEDYAAALDHALDSCAALIAVIGPRWLSLTDDAGRRRLDDPTDWVRAEIRRALERGIRVIPVLISTTMPREPDVPADLKPLLLRQALEISDRRWKQDIELLAQALEKIPGITRLASSVQTSHGSSESPTSFIASHWVQLVLGSSVSIVVGLVPYLGKVIPLFAPVLSILPEAIQPVAIPLSAAAMGIVAVLVQWQGTLKPQPEQVKIWFRRTLLACAVSLAVLAGIETIAVVRVDVPAVDRSVSFAVGPSHPRTPPCATLSRADCIKRQLSLDEASIDSYFGEGWVNVTKFVLVIVYTVFMSTFGALGVMLSRAMKLKFAR
jgi:TIR domain-containing protein